MQVIAIGTAEIEVIVTGNKQTIKIEEVLYVPGLTANCQSKRSQQGLRNKDHKAEL